MTFHKAAWALFCSKLCQAGDAPVELCADEKVGGPLLLEPLVADFQVSKRKSSRLRNWGLEKVDLGCL